MKGVKWFLLWGLVFLTIGCASVDPGLFQSTIADNPNVSPDSLQASLKEAPIEDKQIKSIRYQVYKVGFFNSPKAVYFKDARMVQQAPYDPYANLKILLQLGAISQTEYDKKSYCVGDSCTCLVPVDCNGVCGGPATTDACGVCNGNVLSCTPPLSCMGDSCECLGPTDCAGTCGGAATIDSCGICGGNGSECAPPPSI